MVCVPPDIKIQQVATKKAVSWQGESNKEEITSANLSLGSRDCTVGVINVKVPPNPAKGRSLCCHRVRSHHVGESSGSGGSCLPRGPRYSRSCLRLSGSLASHYMFMGYKTQFAFCPRGTKHHP